MQARPGGFLERPNGARETRGCFSPAPLRVGRSKTGKRVGSLEIVVEVGARSRGFRGVEARGLDEIPALEGGVTEAVKPAR